MRDPECSSLSLIVRDRDDGRRDARVPGVVRGVYGYHIVTAIWIVFPARGLQRNGEGN
jgi:hypothetical protein